MTGRRLRILVLFAACTLPLAFCAGAAAATLSYDTLGGHALVVKPDGSLWAWGNNGALGDCTDKPKSSPVVVFDAFDVTQPKCSAPTATAVRRGTTAVLKYKVTDAPSTTGLVTTWITIKKAGVAEKTIQFGRQKAGVLRACQFRCTLPKGRYRFVVTAIDVGGNRQSISGTNWLTVR